MRARQVATDWFSPLSGPASVTGCPAVLDGRMNDPQAVVRTFSQADLGQLPEGGANVRVANLNLYI